MRLASLRRCFETLTVLSIVVGFGAPLKAQTTARSFLDFPTGGEFETYLRAMQLSGTVPFYPWSIRGLSPRTIAALSAADSSGPWALGARFATSGARFGSASVGVTFNTSYPYGANDGPVWAGRGLTGVASFVAGGSWGPLSFTLAPIAFTAANRPFELLENAQTAGTPFRNASFPNSIDLPQRFGSSAYSRLDPGASVVRFDSRVVSLGVSTANEWIGPATEYPFLLGTNAAGFPHLFVGTGAPLDLWLAHLHARAMWGRLAQSSYSPVTGDEHYTSRTESGTVRLAASAQIVLVPRGAPNLEIGFGRFLHVPNRVGEPSEAFWKKPFKVFFSKNERAQGDTAGADNQLVSVFFRWVLPHSGFELYGERGYEDQFYDFRDFVQDPDHEREYLIGFQKVLRKNGKTIDILKTEILNYQNPTIARLRIEDRVYVHATLRQGHTNEGQLLGASTGPGAGAASTIAWTRYSPLGRTSLTFRRILHPRSGRYLGSVPVGSPANDVIIASGIERMRFGQLIDYGAKIEAMQDLNRNFEKDVPNLNLQLTVQLHPR